jgi:hypothetical protein
MSRKGSVSAALRVGGCPVAVDVPRDLATTRDLTIDEDGGPRVGHPKLVHDRRHQVDLIASGQVDVEAGGLLSARFAENVIDTVRAVVEAAGGTVEMDVAEERLR